MSTITTFQAVLKGLPRIFFKKCVERHQADKHAKRFTHWDHFLALLYGQLSGASSLRMLELGFNSHSKFHRRLGSGPIHRTTLADASCRRTGAVFDEVAAWLMMQVARNVRQKVEEFKYLLDSTSITLKGQQFDEWTQHNRNNVTQGIKLHILLDTESQTPLLHEFSAPNVNDVIVARQVPLQPGALYVFDKGYCDYNWWAQIDATGARFVTRFKINAALGHLKDRPIPKKACGIVLSDEIVHFTIKHPGGKRINHYDKPLRRITIHRPGKTPLVLATNDLRSSALKIAEHYHQRWGIELFFKWIKQHLKIKKFLGQSRNAVCTQILVALICYLLVVLYKQTNRLEPTLWYCLGLIRATLFEPCTVALAPGRTCLHDPPTKAPADPRITR
jgi:putative transposase